jgi:glycosyltransferase involved in cell wall biosynthesis
MEQLDTGGIKWEVLIVDNAGEEATRQVCLTQANRLPLRYLVHTRPGKSAALNRGLREVAGELILPVDDDILPNSTWLREMWEGARRWPDHVVFGGRVLPQWPSDPPDFPSNPIWQRWAFSIYDPSLAEGPNLESLPVGPNMAVRRWVFETGVSFNENVGPKGQNYVMGNETDLILQLTGKGYQPVFLPLSLVYHIIRPEQLDHDWLVRRAFRQGRSNTYLKSDLSWYAVARLAKHALWKSCTYCGALVRGGSAGAFSERIACSLARGRLYEALRRKLAS